jgi:hypothetical protein
MPQSGSGFFWRTPSEVILKLKNLSILHCKRKDKSVNVWRAVSGHWELHRAHEYLVDNLTFTGPCIVVYSYNESQRDTLFLRFI